MFVGSSSGALTFSGLGLSTADGSTDDFDVGRELLRVRDFLERHDGDGDEIWLRNERRKLSFRLSDLALRQRPSTSSVQHLPRASDQCLDSAGNGKSSQRILGR